MIMSSLYSILASFGFGILFNIRGKKLLYASIGGSLGWFSYSILLNLSVSKILAMFLSSLIISIYSEIMARVHKTPVTIFVVCSLIPLVPGGGMYYTMRAFVERNVSQSISIGLETVAIAGALAIAVVLVSSISKLIPAKINKTSSKN